MTSSRDQESDGEGMRGPPFEPPMILIVGRSRITSVVISRIVERSGLHSESETPELAVETIAARMPAIVILDGGATNEDCLDLMPVLSRAREASSQRLPATILLSTRTTLIQDDGSGIIDAVVAKPILPEHLQPVVDRLMERART